jgi:hypothetical protein
VILSSPYDAGGGFTQIQLPLPVPAPIVGRLVRTRVAQAFSIFLHSVDIGSRKLAELRLREDNPEVLIRPDVGGIGLLDTVNLKKIVRLGEDAVEVVLVDLKHATAWPQRLRLKYFPKQEKQT